MLSRTLIKTPYTGIRGFLSLFPGSKWKQQQSPRDLKQESCSCVKSTLQLHRPGSLRSSWQSGVISMSSRTEHVTNDSAKKNGIPLEHSCMNFYAKRGR